jgi:hypothetical protein
MFYVRLYILGIFALSHTLPPVSQAASCGNTATPLLQHIHTLHSSLVSSRRRDRRAPPPDLSLFLAKVLGKLRLDLGASELGHGLRTLDRADAVGPGAGEDDVHFFETATLGFWEEEVDGRDQCSVQYREDDVSPPCKVCERWRCDHDDYELRGV